MSNACEGCGQPSDYDLLIPDVWWERIKPAGKPEGAGLLCPSCIVKRIGKLDGYVGWIAQPLSGCGAELVCLNLLLDAIKHMQDRLIRFDERFAEEEE